MFLRVGGPREFNRIKRVLHIRTQRAAEAGREDSAEQFNQDYYVKSMCLCWWWVCVGVLSVHDPCASDSPELQRLRKKLADALTASEESTSPSESVDIEAYVASLRVCIKQGMNSVVTALPPLLPPRS